MLTLPFLAMGCQMLAVLDRDDARATERLARVPAWFAVWERHLSRFRTDSELSRLALADGQAVRVSPTLAAVLSVALESAELSGGLVTPTLLTALEKAGYDRSFSDLAPEQPARPILPPTSVDWRQIHLDRSRRQVTLPRGLRLDLGGTAKGWAANEAMRRLSRVGPVLIDAGGDIAISGAMADGGPWTITIASPFSETEQLGMLQLASGAVATSGRDYRRWRQGGRMQHHLIDPRTGRPAETDLLTVTVVAATCSLAETAAKVALILGSREGLAWIEARTGLAGLLVLEDGRVLRSRRMVRFLV